VHAVRLPIWQQTRDDRAWRARKVVVSMRRLVCALVLLAVVPCVAGWSWPVRGPVLQTFSFDPAHPYAAGEHRGIAIGADTGAPVVAPASGTVTFAGTVPTNGRSLTILTESGLAVSLTHLGSIAVAQNAGIAEGDVVGSVGPSGTPELDVPYVHLGIRQAANDQGYLDPLGFLPVPGPPAAQPAPASSPAPAPAPASPSAAPAVAVPQSTAVPAPAATPSTQQPAPTPAPASTPAPAPLPTAAAPSVRGVAVDATPSAAAPGVAVRAPQTPPLSPAVPGDRAGLPAPVALVVTRPSAAGPVPQTEPRATTMRRPSLRVRPGHSDGAAVARPPRAQSLAAAVPGSGAHAQVQLATGVGALAAAAIVALLWVRWRLKPPTRRERTALV
jgi:Peptidase family M23